jgi:hypothetical protein
MANSSRTFSLEIYTSHQKIPEILYQLRIMASEPREKNAVEAVSGPSGLTLAALGE